MDIDRLETLFWVAVLALAAFFTLALLTSYAEPSLHSVPLRRVLA